MKNKGEKMKRAQDILVVIILLIFILSGCYEQDDNHDSSNDNMENDNKPFVDDTDNDGIPDNIDMFPEDFDNDGIPDDKDPDDDNDGIPDYDDSGLDITEYIIIFMVFKEKTNESYIFYLNNKYQNVGGEASYSTEGYLESAEFVVENNLAQDMQKSIEKEDMVQSVELKEIAE